MNELNTRTGESLGLQTPSDAFVVLCEEEQREKVLNEAEQARCFVLFFLATVKRVTFEAFWGGVLKIVSVGICTILLPSILTVNVFKAQPLFGQSTREVRQRETGRKPTGFGGPAQRPLAYTV